MTSAIFASGLLCGRVALVTGGGTGLGRATALELARCGAHVTVVGRRTEPLRETAAAIDALCGVPAGGTSVCDGRAPGDSWAPAPATTASGGDLRSAHWLAGDIRDQSTARQLVDATFGRWGRLDILVNNAGGQYFVPAEHIVAKGWAAVWRLNVDGMLFMSHAALRACARSCARVGGRGDGAGVRAGGGTAVGAGGVGEGAGGDAGVGAGGVGGGAGGRVREDRAEVRAGTAVSTGLRIINVTLSPHHGMPGMAHSGAARAAVEALTRELATRHAASGVSACAIAAGHFDTDAMGKYPDVVRAGMARSVPLGRLGTVEEHAWLVALLASPLGAAFNGSTLTLDGARDNWFGPWPPPGLAGEEGRVPTEARRGASSAT